MVIFQDLHLVPSYLKTHATIMATTFLIIYPLGVWLITTTRRVWPHVLCQMLGWILMLVGFGDGLRMAQIIGRVRLSLQQCAFPVASY